MPVYMYLQHLLLPLPRCIDATHTVTCRGQHKTARLLLCCSTLTILRLLCAGPPFRTALFAFQRRVPVGNDPVFDKLFEEFLNGSDAQRKARFKYLPRIDVAPKMLLRGVRMIGGEKPTMLCNKLTPTFFRGDNYIEVTIDIASSKPANMVTGLILPKLADVVVSHAFLLEGHSEEELPERIMGCVKTSGLRIEENTVSV
jgi:hypothetical protein